MRTWTGLLAAAAVSMTAYSGSAVAQGKVVLYTAHKTSLVQALAPIFEAETGVQDRKSCNSAPAT